MRWVNRDLAVQISRLNGCENFEHKGQEFYIQPFYFKPFSLQKQSAPLVAKMSDIHYTFTL